MASTESQAPIVTQRVVVLGESIAVAAAAMRLVDAGLPVTVYECKPQEASVLPAVLPGAAVNALELLKQLGMGDRLQRSEAITITSTEGRDTLRADDLPAPLHVLPALVGLGALTLSERLAFGRGLLAILQTSPEDLVEQGTDQATFSDWVLEQMPGALGESDRMYRLWDALAVVLTGASAVYLPASTGVAAVREGLLQSRQCLPFAVLAADPSDVVEAAASRVIGTGGQWQALDEPFELMKQPNGLVEAVVLPDGTRVEADHVVWAGTAASLLEYVGLDQELEAGDVFGQTGGQTGQTQAVEVQVGDAEGEDESGVGSGGDVGGDVGGSLLAAAMADALEQQGLILMPYARVDVSLQVVDGGHPLDLPQLGLVLDADEGAGAAGAVLADQGVACVAGVQGSVRRLSAYVATMDLDAEVWGAEIAKQVAAAHGLSCEQVQVRVATARHLSAIDLTRSFGEADDGMDAALPVNVWTANASSSPQTSALVWEQPVRAGIEAASSLLAGLSGEASADDDQAYELAEMASGAIYRFCLG